MLLRPFAAAEQRQPHAKEYLSAGMVYAAELCGLSPRLGHLIQLDVDNRVRENERPDCPHPLLTQEIQHAELCEVPCLRKHRISLHDPDFRGLLLAVWFWRWQYSGMVKSTAKRHSKNVVRQMES
jgi:hypothetical protein